jgi:oxaloacetate decarboxylase alpha subunit/pyruvate carboxylase subunit B
MSGKLLIRDVTLRDGQQSLFATRMTQAQVDQVLPLYKDAGFYALEVWGGAVPDSVMRYLNEDPWERLSKIHAATGGASHLTALSRGRNLFGYSPYPDEVIEGFNRLAVQSGISIMRIFDALNDVSNMVSTIKYVKQNGGIADCAICYTVDPHFAAMEKVKAFFTGRTLPRNIFTVDYYIQLAVILEQMGADMISVKDMAGLIPPSLSGELVRGLKRSLAVPVDFHTHCTPGYGLASTLMAILNGADIVDTALLNFSGGTAAPAYELIQIFADKLGIETGVNREEVVRINDELRLIRLELAEFGSDGPLPRDFNISNYKLPEGIDKRFDDAIRAAHMDKEDDLLEACNAIEEWFGLPGAD